MNGSQEQLGNVPLQTSNNEEEDKPVTSGYIKENGTEEDAQQSVEKGDQMSELAGSQAETTEMT